MTTSASAAAPGRHGDSRLLVPLALVSLYLIWGSTYLAISVALKGYPPFALAAIRFALAGTGLYAFLRLRGVAPPTRRQWRNAAVTGVLLLLGGNGLVCFAEQHVASASLPSRSPPCRCTRRCSPVSTASGRRGWKAWVC